MTRAWRRCETLQGFEGAKRQLRNRRKSLLGLEGAARGAARCSKAGWPQCSKGRLAAFWHVLGGAARPCKGLRVPNGGCGRRSAAGVATARLHTCGGPGRRPALAGATGRVGGFYDIMHLNSARSGACTPLLVAFLYQQGVTKFEKVEPRSSWTFLAAGAPCQNKGGQISANYARPDSRPAMWELRALLLTNWRFDSAEIQGRAVGSVCVCACKRRTFGWLRQSVARMQICNVSGV